MQVVALEGMDSILLHFEFLGSILDCIYISGTTYAVTYTLIASIVLGPVVRSPVSASLGLNFNLGFFFLLSKAVSRIFSLFFLEYPIIKL